jgi:hypothetical protein
VRNQAANPGNTSGQTATTKVRIAGTITAVSSDGTTVTVTPSGQANSPTIDVTIVTGTAISLDGTKGKTAAHLLPGMMIQADCQMGATNSTAMQIQASGLLRVQGTISALTPATGSTTAGTVTIASANGSTTALNVDLSNGTTVTLDGSAVVALSSLSTGMRAEARYQVTSSGNKASTLRVHSQK